MRGEWMIVFRLRDNNISNRAKEIDEKRIASIGFDAFIKYIQS